MYVGLFTETEQFKFCLTWLFNEKIHPIIIDEKITQLLSGLKQMCFFSECHITFIVNQKGGQFSNEATSMVGYETIYNRTDGLYCVMYHTLYKYIVFS